MLYPCLPSMAGDSPALLLGLPLLLPWVLLPLLRLLLLLPPWTCIEGPQLWASRRALLLRLLLLLQLRPLLLLPPRTLTGSAR